MKNYTIKNLGPWSGIEGKQFLGEELQLTGAQISVQKYVILSGKGEYQVDGEVFPVQEGSVVRVSPAGVRALRNSGDTDMVMMCLQYEQHPISSFMEDANVSDAPVRW